MSLLFNGWLSFDPPIPLVCDYTLSSHHLCYLQPLIQVVLLDLTVKAAT